MRLWPKNRTDYHDYKDDCQCYTSVPAYCRHLLILFFVIHCQFLWPACDCRRRGYVIPRILNAGRQPRISPPMLREDLFEGDMVLDRQGRYRNAAKYAYLKWKDNLVPYEFATSKTISEQTKKGVMAAIDDFHRYTCVVFVPRTNERDYLSFYSGDGYKPQSCHSEVGRKGGRQTISLGTGCHWKGVVIHEILHTLGFYHEQSRHDRDEYVTIHWSNIKRGFSDQFNRASTNNQGIPYDYNSVMHYESNAFTRNGKDTITPRIKNVQIGQRRGFSTEDVRKVNTLYNCPEFIITTESPDVTPPAPQDQDFETTTPLVPTGEPGDYVYEEDTPPAPATTTASTLPTPQPLLPLPVPLPQSELLVIVDQSQQVISEQTYVNATVATTSSNVVNATIESVTTALPSVESNLLEQSVIAPEPVVVYEDYYEDEEVVSVLEQAIATTSKLPTTAFSKKPLLRYRRRTTTTPAARIGAGTPKRGIKPQRRHRQTTTKRPTEPPRALSSCKRKICFTKNACRKRYARYCQSQCGVSCGIAINAVNISGGSSIVTNNNGDGEEEYSN